MWAVSWGKDTFVFPSEIASYFVFMQNPKDILHVSPQLRNSCLIQNTRCSCAKKHRASFAFSHLSCIQLLNAYFQC